MKSTTATTRLPPHSWLVSQYAGETTELVIGARLSEPDFKPSPATIQIGDRRVGEGDPTFVIAEAGVNHNGSVDLAHQLVDVAADAGADAVKFQTFRPEALVASDAPAANYQRDRGAENQLEMLRELTLPESAWKELAAHAEQRGLAFLSTAFDEDSLELLLNLGVPALKSPSGEITNLPFLDRLARANLPLIISTGGATLDEVDRAVNAASGAPGIAILHCVTAYPAPTDQSNLRAIPALASRFEVPVGWSDHTTGHVTAVAAVALGASILEKHVTTDRGLPGPDHVASASPKELHAYVTAVRTTGAALGDGVKRPTAAEADNLPLVRRSYHARRRMTAGSVLTEEDVQLVRPAVGLPPDSSPLGRTLTNDLEPGDPVRSEDIG